MLFLHDGRVTESAATAAVAAAVESVAAATAAAEAAEISGFQLYGNCAMCAEWLSLAERLE